MLRVRLNLSHRHYYIFCVNLSRARYCQELQVIIYCYYNAMFPISYLASSPSFSSSSHCIVKVA